MSQSIHVGAVAPYALITTLESIEDPSGNEPYWNLASGVTGAVFEVRSERGVTTEWAAELSNAGAIEGGSKIMASHPFAEGDVPSVGTVYVRARLAHSLHGVIYSETFKLLVIGDFA